MSFYTDPSSRIAAEAAQCKKCEARIEINEKLHERNVELGKERDAAQAENVKLREYKSAFVKLGAEIAQSGCCTHGPLADDPVNDPPIHAANCVRERLILRFLTAKRALEESENG